LAVRVFHLHGVEDAIITALLDSDGGTIPKVLALQIVGKGTVARPRGGIFQITELGREYPCVGKGICIYDSFSPSLNPKTQ
jgi:hypothetical protein